MHQLQVVSVVVKLDAVTSADLIKTTCCADKQHTTHSTSELHRFRKDNDAKNVDRIVTETCANISPF